MEGFVMKFLLACYTNKGRIKEVNQDALLVNRERYRGKEAVLAVICDGMGGLECGETASAEVIRAFDLWFREDFQDLADQEEFEDELYDSWEMLFQKVHQKIREYGRIRGIRIGTTATAMLLWEERFYIAHVGDCRIYEIKEQIRQLTRDQVQGELRRRDGEPGTAGVKAGEHILLQGVGASQTLRPAYHSGDVKAEAVYLLCTDGFRHKVSEQELREAFAPEEMVDEKVMRSRGGRIAEVVMERGERDNLSVILLRSMKGMGEKGRETHTGLDRDK